MVGVFIHNYSKTFGRNIDQVAVNLVYIEYKDFTLSFSDNAPLRSEPDMMFLLRNKKPPGW